MSFKEKVRSAVKDGGVVDKALIWAWVATGLLSLVQGDWLNALVSLAVITMMRRIGFLAQKLRDAGVTP